ncbi:MAG: YjgP/YjgQ family permease [Flavobacteriaceae bacterium]|nr:YjgP/YjgQ family permease [Flavobacteriaceae bacterium]
MKILDRYILTSYLKTFLSVFVILMLIFVLQSVWLYISELAGKDLELDVIIKFLMYVSPRLIVLVLPLTILLSSIMVFGSFAENYEFAAMKSTGISLQRTMRSLSIFIVLLAVTTFFFSNNVIPSAEFKFYNLRRNIAKVKPAMAIAEGQFNQIGSINIKVANKSGDKGQYLEDVIIHQKKGNYSGNHTVIKSKTGEITSSVDSDVLQLVLYDGNYYDALQPKNYNEREINKPFIKSSFEIYTLNVDLSQINNVDFDNADVSTKYSMLTAKELDYTIDSLKVKLEGDYEKLTESMYNRTTASTLNKNIKPNEVDSVVIDDSLLKMFKKQKHLGIVDQAINTLKSTQQIVQAQKRTFGVAEKNINKHIIAFYEKFALGFACIILFFVGAPLGALIKKGGMGLPIVIAIVLFLTYHFIGIFAKNSAEDGSLNPILSTWLSTLIMLPLSIYLTNRATKDRTLLDLDAVLIPLKKVIRRKVKLEIDTDKVLDSNSEALNTLQDYSNEKLIDIIKNYRQYDFDIAYRNSALKIMNSRGITKQELRYSGNLVNDNYENALRHLSSYKENSAIALILYITYVVLGVGGLVLRNNGFPKLGVVLIIIGVLALILFLVALIKSYTNQTSFYKLLNKNRASNIIFLFILGIPLYFIYNIFFNKKMEEELKDIR